MRMRNKKNRLPRMQRCEDIWIKDAKSAKGSWHTLFGNDNPIHIEIGCGKGGFVAGMAAQNPDINYVAIERYENVLVLAMEKVKNAALTNILFIDGDAMLLDEYFQDGEFERIYLNFSDPWPKKKTAKRRLTHTNFLNIYSRLLPDGGGVFFKTDNRALFEFSLNSFADADFKMKNITFDLHNSGFEGNVMTEYEKKFSEEGMPIYRVEAYPRERKR